MLHRAEEQHRGDQSEELDEGDTQPHGPDHVQLAVKPALQRVGTSLVPPQRRVLGSANRNRSYRGSIAKEYGGNSPAAVGSQQSIAGSFGEHLALIVQGAAAGLGHPALARPRLDVVPVLVRGHAAALKLGIRGKRRHLPKMAKRKVSCHSPIAERCPKWQPPRAPPGIPGRSRCNGARSQSAAHWPASVPVRRGRERRWSPPGTRS